jgi:RND family efflux transporter MFP subunit
MRLEPAYAGSSTSIHERASLPGTVQINPERQQLIGVRTALAAKTGAVDTLRLPGRVAPDEARTYNLTASTDCWIRHVYPPTTGALVHKDEPLLAFYTTAFLSAAQAYMYALNTLDRHQASGTARDDQLNVISTQIRQAVESLQVLGVSDRQIEEMRESRKVPALVDLRSPVTGLVLARNASPGQYVGTGSELYRIADLSRVWVLADLFEKDASYARSARTATVHYQGHTISASVSRVLPQFDASTRSLKLRLEIDNPAYHLRPDMFVDVELAIDLPEAVAVPVEAVLDTGRSRAVFVDRGGGVFERRQIETGWRMGDRVAVRAGLQDGERVVVSGHFLLDSEARMHSIRSFGSTTPRPTDPICGMQVDPTDARFQLEASGTTVYFCSESCLRRFRSRS